ncbi:MAG: TIGR03087 family PEP-CTERM/XrtA system glycosyltransferase [Alphaproteobacteria bacterium]|nr:TIGR03087 family PEP-CTERM/XrtA system glycosyltransferase [Alphaproteobacteria bacterium]
MAEILFLVHRIPYPPNKGDKIRSWHFLEHLAAHHTVRLGCFVDEPDDWQHIETLKGVCAEVHAEPLPRSPLAARNLAALRRGLPISVQHYSRPSFAAWVADTLKSRPVDAIFAFSGTMAQFALDPPGPVGARVIDFVDVDSDKWRQYARRKAPPMRWVYAREAATLLGFERRVAAAFDAAGFVSENETALFRRLAPESAARAHTLPNGVNLAFFEPDLVYDTPFPGDALPLVFTGAMDYWANADAVVWFAREALPAIRREKPRAGFWIVGANPLPEVKALAELPEVTVTGRVSDIRPYLAHAAVVVAPMRIARGVQNKVLEGMAMAKPVVTTSLAAAGVEAAVPGEEVLLADTPDATAEAVLALIDAPERGAAIGRKGRRRIRESYAWEASFAKLDALLGLVEPAAPLAEAVRQ